MILSLHKFRSTEYLFYGVATERLNDIKQK